MGVVSKLLFCFLLIDMYWHQSYLYWISVVTLIIIIFCLFHLQNGYQVMVINTNKNSDCDRPVQVRKRQSTLQQRNKVRVLSKVTVSTVGEWRCCNLLQTASNFTVSGNKQRCLGRWLWRDSTRGLLEGSDRERDQTVPQVPVQNGFIWQTCQTG